MHKTANIGFHRFRWVVCQLDALRKRRTTEQVKKALKPLPKRLDDTYVRILKDDENVWRSVCDIVTLIDFSSRVPGGSEFVRDLGYATYSR